jgi:hypothetical protein
MTAVFLSAHKTARIHQRIYLEVYFGKQRLAVNVIRRLT